MRLVTLILLIPLVLSAQVTPGRKGSPQTAGGATAAPPPPPPTPAADLGLVEGQALNALTGAPLRKATIRMDRQSNQPLAQGMRTSYSATTNESGQFSIAGVEP